MTNLSGSFWIFFGVLLLENVVGISIGLVLSASFKNTKMAAQIAPMVVILFLMFSGFLINEESVPAYFIWLREISFIRYTFKAVAVNEFEGQTFECSAADLTCITEGEQVLAMYKFGDGDVISEAVVILAAIAGVANLIAFAILLYRRPRFLTLDSSTHVKELVAGTSTSTTEVLVSAEAGLKDIEVSETNEAAQGA